MVWQPYYHGDSRPRGAALPPPPPWRSARRSGESPVFEPPPGLVEAVNAALHLRRPLLLTGAPGSGKSSVIDSVAAELELGPVLRWHITSRSELRDALYRYDVLGRVHQQQLPDADRSDEVADFMQLGPLGTALLPGERPRALLIDEFDKSDFDLPGDLLNVLESGEFEIQELARHRTDVVAVREWGGIDRHSVTRGVVRCSTFPVIVITSNGERDFPAPFLRRCVRFTMPAPDAHFLQKIVGAHLGSLAGSPVVGDVIDTFVGRLDAGERIAVDQLLNAVFVLTGADTPQDGDERARMLDLMLRELSRA